MKFKIDHSGGIAVSVIPFNTFVNLVYKIYLKTKWAANCWVPAVTLVHDDITFCLGSEWF